MASKKDKMFSRIQNDSRLYTHKAVVHSLGDQEGVSYETSTAEISHGQRSPRPRRQQYAFDDIAALKKDIPSWTKKDDFVLIYKTSSDQVQYIRDKKDLLIPWAQILTAEPKSAGRLGIFFQNKTDSKLKSDVRSTSMTDLYYESEEFRIGRSDTVPDSSDSDTSRKSDIANQNYLLLTPPIEAQEEMCNIEKCLCGSPDATTRGKTECREDKYAIQTAISSKDTVNEGDIDHTSIKEKYEDHTLKPNISINKLNDGILSEDRKFAASETHSIDSTPSYFTYSEEEKEEYEAQGDKNQYEKAQGDKSQGYKTQKHKTQEYKNQGYKTQGEIPQQDKPQEDETQEYKTQKDKTQGYKTQRYKTQIQGEEIQGNETKEYKSQADRTQKDKTQPYKTQGHETQGYKTEGDKYQGHKTRAYKTQEEKTQVDKTQGYKTQGYKTQRYKTQGRETQKDKFRYETQGYKTEEDIAQGDKYEGYKTQVYKTQEDETQEYKTQAEITQGDIPQGDMPQGDIPQGDMPQGDIPQGDIPQGGIPQGYIPQGDVSQGDIPLGDIPQGDISQGYVPQGDIPQGNILQEDIPQGDILQGDIPQGDIFQGDIPQGDIPQRDEKQGYKTKGSKTQGDKTPGFKVQGVKTERYKTQGGKIPGKNIQRENMQENKIQDDQIQDKIQDDAEVDEDEVDEAEVDKAKGDKAYENIAKRDKKERIDNTEEIDDNYSSMDIADYKHINWTRNDFVDYRDLNHTGYFRDQRRRIDMIIVVDDTANESIEKIKDCFFTNCINAGLELELEMGVLPKNSGLVFIKVHAPEPIILQLSKHYNFRKYFKVNHLELIKDAVPDEKDIIKCVRRNYPGPYAYSTIDRIYMVYRLLRFMPFGEAENYRGVEKLLERGIIRDIYPLHDGPYYIMDSTYGSINGRQALHENWVGSENVLKRQPIHTIREYLGERMGFLFAFFEFYNLCLVATWVFGTILFVIGYFSKLQDIINNSACTNNTYKFPHWFTETVWLTYRFTYTWTWDRWDLLMFNNFVRNITKECRTDWWKWWGWHPCPYNYQLSRHRVQSLKAFGVSAYGWWSWLLPPVYYNVYTWTTTYSRVEWRIGVRSNYKITTYYDLPICPKCKDFQACPFINMTIYCLEVKIKNTIDNPYAIFGLAFIVLWGIIFSQYWHRRECYLYWMWECRAEDADITYRPDFMKEQDKRMLKYLIKAFVVLFILVVYFFGVLPVLLVYLKKTSKQMIYYYHTHESLVKGNYFNVAMLALLNSFIVLGIQGVCTKVAFPLNRICHNQRTEKQYERSLTFMLFGFTFYSNFGLIFYFIYLKGIMYTHPADESRWYTPLGLGYTNCGMLTCIDEALVMLVVTQLSKKCYTEFDQMFHYHPSELVGGQWINQNVPCWEKELELLPITEADIMKRFNYLLFQFLLVTFFFWIFPFAGGLAFFANIFEIRYWSKEFILHSRRPLPMKTWGLKSWGTLLTMLPYMGALIQITAFIRLSNVISRSLHARYFPGIRYFMDFAMGMFNTSDFFNSTGMAKSSGNFIEGTPAHEWHMYTLASFNKHLYPHWQKSDFCLFPNMYNRRYRSHKLMRVYENSYMPNLNFWHHMWLKLLAVLAFEQFTILSGIILNMLIDKCSEKVRATRDIEAMIKINRLKFEDIKKRM